MRAIYNDIKEILNRIEELLLEFDPELAKHVQKDYLASRDSKISGFFKKTLIKTYNKYGI